MSTNKNKEEKKTLTLADMGLEDETPAEAAAKHAEEAAKPTKVIHDKSGEGDIEVFDANSVDKKEVERLMQESDKKEEEAEKKPVIPTPNMKPGPNGSTDGKSHYQKADLSKYVSKKKEEDNPIRKTLDTFYDYADKGIEREKKELLSPTGRITEAKFKYIEEHYAILEKRAKNNDRLASRMKAVGELIDTDPRFDGITDHERKGYILFVVAHDEKTGVNNEYFGIEHKKGEPYKPSSRLSSDANREIEALVKEEDEDDLTDFYSDEAELDLGTNKTDKPAVPDISKATVQEDEDDKDNVDLLLSDDDTTDTEEEEEDIAETMPEEQRKRILNDYHDQLVNDLNLNTADELEGFTIQTKPIKLNAALRDKQINSMSIIWPLQFSGIPVELTPFSGEEIMALSPTNTNFDTVEGLKTIFTTIYHHIINPGKPKFEIWLRQISDYDIDGLLFAVYVANFKDTNYITYECPNKKCKKIFLVKKDIMEMVTFPNDEVKKRFEQIQKKETVMTQMYKSHPRRISEDYAIGFVSQSIYSNLFEPAALDKEFTDKYSSIVDIMPNIDKVYRIDKANKSLIPISFGVDKTSLKKTVMRKVKGLDVIFKTFTPDERSIAIGEARKISRNFDKDKITYSIPATTCPSCKEEIKRVDANPLNLLFTRAQLPIVAASIQE